jgi:TldD protein
VPGEYDVICAPDIAGLIAHEAFGHGVEMDMFVKGRAKGAEFINKEVASKLTTMHDGAAAAKHMSSYFFDDEGTIGTDTVVIENGILMAGISDLLSAIKLGTKPTGNGKRQSFERKAYARMTNTFFEAGKDKLEDMIASIEKGYLIEGMYSGMEDPKNWGSQCIANVGREIKDGKLTENVISPVIMTGFVPDLLKSISMVSEEVELGGAGYCGKGYKEYVKTSSGGPYIKAKVRLG